MAMKNSKRVAAARSLPQPEPPATPSLQDAIAHLAYAYWEADGRPEGCDLDYWLRAEREVLASRGDA